MSVSRRDFLSGAAAGVAGTALTGGLLIEGSRRDAHADEVSAPSRASYPFHGAHQAGILDPLPSAKQAFAMVMSFDVVEGTSRTELIGVLRTLTQRARLLTTGYTAPQLGIAAPPSDSDVLGPQIEPDGLTVTLGLGASLFDDRFGLTDRKPKRLTPMRIFPNDSPIDSQLHGDLSLQLCANHQDVLHHAVRDIAKHTRGVIQLRWKMQGYNSPPRPSGTSRNLLGFKDGTANPTGDLAQQLVWVDSADEPAWTRGGTYQVVRLIRMLVEFWDRVSINEQETMFGRRRDSGAPLDGNSETDIPDYAADPKGNVIPLDSHIRLANPRTHATADQRLLRRSFNYDEGVDSNGNLSAGHIFLCYQQDVHRQFETVQERLVGEPLIDYVQPFGGGYFFVPPGVRDRSDWYASGLFA